MTRTEALYLAAELEALDYILIGDKVAIVRDEPEQMVGKIHVPDTAQSPKLAGTIVMIGEGLKQKPELYGKVKLGQWATFNKYNGVLHTIQLSDRKVAVEVYHGLDLYIVWGKEGEESPFAEA